MAIEPPGVGVHPFCGGERLEMCEPKYAFGSFLAALGMGARNQYGRLDQP